MDDIYSRWVAMRNNLGQLPAPGTGNPAEIISQVSRQWHFGRSSDSPL